MYCYQGKEHFCSILFTSQKPENVKTTLVKCLLGDPENFELLLFYCFLSFFKRWWTNVHFRGSGGKKKETAQVTGPSWSDTILREISTFSSVILKGDPATQPDWHQPVRDKVGHPGASLRSIYKWNGKPKQQAFASVSILLFCALLEAKAGTKRVSVCV